MSEQHSAENVWVVIDVGCHECGVGSETVGMFWTREEACAALEQREQETGGWRDGGQTICTMYYMALPARFDGPVRCADGSLIHDFKGQTSCPACGYAPALFDGRDDAEV